MPWILPVVIVSLVGIASCENITTGRYDATVDSRGANATSEGHDLSTLDHHQHESCELTVASFDWAYVEHSFILAVFLFFSALTKLGFHHAGYLVTKVPESCLLIVLGTLAGILFTFTTNTDTFPDELKTMQPDLFFLVLLPPIVLEASYSLHNRVFLDNLGSILVFAVVGTIASFALIGPLLYIPTYFELVPEMEQFSFIHCMLFASIVVAVDPVAVLAIFQEVGVNNVLYFLVFGESLLNDAVTVVLYHTVEGMSCVVEKGETITPLLYAIAFFKFFAVSFGGIAIGSFYGILTSLLTKYTVETRVVEPLLLFALAYLAYVTSELFHFSGIISITVCGLLQAQYAFHNISHKSYVTVKYFTKMASAASDSVIFLYLGLNLVRTDHEFRPWFILIVVTLTLLARFLIVYGLGAILNRSRVRKMTKTEQFIMAYGGLRGAVAFSLVSLLTGKLDHNIQNAFMTTILVVIIFTVFIQGATIKPLVSLLNIRTKDKDQKLLLFTELNDNVTDHIMAGIEEIVGTHGQFFFYDWFFHLDDKYIKHKLQRNPLRKDEKIMKLYEKIALKQHFATLNGTVAAQNFIRQSLSLLREAPLPPERQSVLSYPQLSETRRVGYPSLLSQLTRYGNIEEPEHEDDIAYITTEMLDDEDYTSVQKRKIGRQQTVIAEDLKDPGHLRLLLNKPGSNMDARELRSKVDMDDRSNLMYLLQEKNKRLERFKNSISHAGYDPSMFQVAASGMATIPEAHRAFPSVIKRIFRRKSGRRGQIVRKPGAIGRQGSAMATKRGGVFASANSYTSGASAKITVPPTQAETQKTLQNGNRVTSEEVLTAFPPTENSERNKPGNAQADAFTNRNQSNQVFSVDSVFYRAPEEVELLGRSAQHRDTIGDILETIQDTSDRDLEKGDITLPAESSTQSVRLRPLPEATDREACAPLIRQAAVVDDSYSVEADEDKDSADYE